MKGRAWTKDEEWQLLDWLGQHRTHAEIGERLGRSKGAVQARATKLKERLLSGNGLTASATARLLGVDQHAVAWWIREGWLPAEESKISMGRGCVFFVQRHHLEEFLADERYWHLIEPERITDQNLRNWLLDLRRGVTFLTTAQAGAELGISHYAVNQLIRAGRLRAVKHGPNWLVRSDQCVYPVGAPYHRGPLRTEAEKTLIRCWWGKRNAIWIAQQIGCSDASVHAWARRMGLPRLGRGAYKRRAAS